MRFFKLIFVFFAMLVIATGCSTEAGDDYCFQQLYTGIDTVTGPETTTVNEPIQLEATFKIVNTCGSFMRFNTTPGYPKKILAVVNYVGCSCAETLQNVTRPYTFEASQPGEYELRFIKPDETYIVKTITVTE
jgi:hypothetical protein